MKKFYWLMMVIAMVLGIGMMPSNASATSTTKHVTVPASMRGTWTTHRDKKKNSTSFKMTKYSIYITDYHKGIKTNRLWLHGSTFKKGSKAIPFQLRKQTSKDQFHGYWFLNSSGLTRYLKATTKKYKGHKVKVIRQKNYNYGYTPTTYTYYYKK